MDFRSVHRRCSEVIEWKNEVKKEESLGNPISGFTGIHSAQGGAPWAPKTEEESKLTVEIVDSPFGYELRASAF